MGINSPGQIAVSGGGDVDLDAAFRELVAAAHATPAPGPWDDDSSSFIDYADDELLDDDEG